MDISIIIIILVVISVISNMKKAKKAEEEKRKRAQQAAANMKVDPPPDIRFPQEDRKAEEADPRFPDISTPPRRNPTAVAQEQARQAHLKRAEELARQRKERLRETPITTRTTSDLRETVGMRMEETKGRKHELETAAAPRHVHVENSMGSMEETPCPPMQPAWQPVWDTKPASSRMPSRDNLLVQGIVLSEILGKPRALRPFGK